MGRNWIRNLYTAPPGLSDCGTIHFSQWSSLDWL
jgi:hypothetical protein